MRSSKKQIKRTLSLALAVLLMLTTPLAALATEEIPEEEEKIETIVDSEDSLEEIEEVEEQKIIVGEENELPEEIEEEIKQEEEINPVVEELDETKEGQQELLGASGDIIYWGITDGVLQISVSEVGGEHSGHFSISENPCPWDDYRDTITAVYVGDDKGNGNRTVRPKNMSWWFYYLSNLEEIDFVNIDTSNVTDMNSLFVNCYKLKNLDVSSFDTGNVTNMHQMFDGCWNVESLDVGNFDTHNVKDMGYMFERCGSLDRIDISGFNTSNVTSMEGMFLYCESFETIDLSSLDTRNVTNMHQMFDGCLNIENLDVRRFDTQNVTDMHRMFNECESLESIDLSSFDTRKVQDMRQMFDDCTELRKIYVGNGFSTESLNDKRRDGSMFNMCVNLVGGNGTIYSEDHVDSTYARIDDPENGNPGYFTQSGTLSILDPSLAVTDAEYFVSDSINVKAQINDVPKGSDIIFRIKDMDGFNRVKTDEYGIAANTYKFNTEGKYSIEIAYEGQVASVDISVNPKRMLCMVSFETNGGSAVPLQFVNENDLARNPEDPTKPGNVFAGWFSDPELTKQFDFSTPITQNITLYAKWIEKSKDTHSSGSVGKPLFTGTVGNPVSDGTWNYDAETDTWSYRTTQQFADTWAYITNPWNGNKPAWFLFDHNGKMMTGWQKINNSWYYLHPFKDGILGECLIGPAMTPDGYYVDETGAWIEGTK